MSTPGGLAEHRTPDADGWLIPANIDATIVIAHSKNHAARRPSSTILEQAAPTWKTS